MGEYAVLHGRTALVCALDKRIYVTLTPRQDKQINIFSNLGNLQTTLATLAIDKKFSFVTATLKSFQNKFPSGFDIAISSDFSEKIGFGSSAAVTVAVIFALDCWLKLQLAPKEMIKMARKIICKVQGSGSGADAAASVLGGVISYRINKEVKRIIDSLPITLVYSGYKTKTPEVIAKVKNNFASNKKIHLHLLNSIDLCVKESINKIMRNDWVGVGSLMNINHGVMNALGVSDVVLERLISQLRNEKNIFGAKISGSGLGDCVIGLGAVEEFHPQISDAKHISVKVSSEGVRNEKT